MIATARMLESEFGLMPIASYGDINQNGQFLAFKGLENVKPNIRVLKFSIIIVANTLMRDKNSLLLIIEELESNLFKKSSKDKQVWLKNITSGFITQSLYAYSLNLEIERKRSC